MYVCLTPIKYHNSYIHLWFIVSQAGSLENYVYASDGAPLTIYQWWDSEPDGEACVYLHKDEGKMFAEACHTQASVVCEYKWPQLGEDATTQESGTQSTDARGLWQSFDVDATGSQQGNFQP